MTFFDIEHNITLYKRRIERRPLLPRTKYSLVVRVSNSVRPIWTSDKNDKSSRKLFKELNIGD